ncbi:MAG: YcnI family protein [Rhodoferax sp.]
MNHSLTLKSIAATSLLMLAASTFAHIVLDQPAALAGTSYKAVFRVGHGCAGSPTTAIKVLIPAGFRGAKPMPKPGWVLSIQREKLAQPYETHGRLVTDAVTQITWTAASRDDWLSNDWYDEFVLRGGLPAEAGALWFKVLQTCEQGGTDWAEIPSSGTSTHGLKAPAALLEIIPIGHVGHAH